MKFIVTYEWLAGGEVRDAGIARFKQNGGLPPTGVKLLGRWTRTDMGGGWLLLESDDAAALAAFALGWSDLMRLQTTPVLDDNTLAEVLANH